MDELVRVLKACTLFSPLPDSDLEPLARRARVRWFCRGTDVYSCGDAGHSVMELTRGLVKMQVVGSPPTGGPGGADGGRQTTLFFVEERELFGEAALFDTGRRRECAVAVEDSQVVFLPKGVLVSMLQEHAVLALAFTRLVSRRRRAVEARLADLLFASSRERMIRILCELVEAHGERSGNRVEIRLPLSHSDLAGLIGVSRETVTLALGELQAAGLVEVSRRRVVITDFRRLGAVPTPPG